MTGMRLRPLRISDTSRVLEAFTSAGDMARQGRVTDPLEAEAYVARLLDPDAAHLPFAMAGEGDLLFGLVALSVDSGNRNAWFWYWTHPASRGVALAAGFVQEGLEREKFLIDGQRIDVVTYGRLANDPIPRTEPLPIIAAPRGGRT